MNDEWQINCRHERSRSAAQRHRGSLQPRNPVTRPLIFIAFALVIVAGRTTALRAGEPFEAQPYRVLISVALENDPAFSRNYRSRTLASLREVIQRGFGTKWRTEITANDWLLPASSTGLARITLSSIKSHVDTSSLDKAFFVSVSTVGARYDIAARQWDAATQSLGPAISAQTYDRADVAATTADVISRLFEPLLIVERVEGNRVILRSRAGRYTAPGAPSAHVQPGEVIQPFFRYLDDQQIVRRIQKLPWTYLIVDEVNGGRVKCTLISGLRAPLGGSRRRSVDVIAARVRPHLGSTELKLVPRGDPTKPLIGYAVTAVSKRQVRDEPTGESLKLVTNRNGVIEVPVSNEGPLVWLYVRSGESLLSRVPYVPGIDATTMMELPDDSIRLDVEGKTDLLMIRLVDTVAKRAVHIARARIQAREGDWKNVDKQLAAIDKLPVMRNFESELTLIRVSAVEEAQREKNRSAEANVMRICSRVSNLITRYLDEGPVRTLKADIVELKNLDKVDKQLLEKDGR